MLGVITDGLWSPPAATAAPSVEPPISTGGALGGVPERPELSIPRPEILVSALRPAIRAAVIAGVRALIHPSLRPQVTVHEVRPTPPEES